MCVQNHVSTVPSPPFQVPVVYCVDLLIGRNLRWCASRELPKEQDMHKPSKVESLLRRGPGSLTGARPSLLDRLAPAMLQQCLAQYLKSMVLRPHSVTTQCDCTFITAVLFCLSMTKLRNPKSTSQLGLNANLQLPLGRCEIVVLEFQFQAESIISHDIAWYYMTLSHCIPV